MMRKKPTRMEEIRIDADTIVTIMMIMIMMMTTRSITTTMATRMMRKIASSNELMLNPINE